MIYEVTFRGRLPSSLRLIFEEFEISTTEPTTTVRGDLPDQAALHGLIGRAQRLGLELVEVRAAGDVS
jgi:hypothetical protein